MKKTIIYLLVGLFCVFSGFLSGYLIFKDKPNNTKNDDNDGIVEYVNVNFTYRLYQNTFIDPAIQERYKNDIAYITSSFNTDKFIKGEYLTAPTRFTSEDGKRHYHRYVKGFFADISYTTHFDFNQPITKDTMIFILYDLRVL